MFNECETLHQWCYKQTKYNFKEKNDRDIRKFPSDAEFKKENHFEKEDKLNGIYLILDKCETENSHAENQGRIVYIGINKEGKQDLIGRLKYHKGNNRDISSLRTHIGRAHIKKKYKEGSEEYEDKINSWNSKKKSKIEDEVSEYMQEHMYFVLIKEDNLLRRMVAELGLIGLVSRCDKCKPSKGWLGNDYPKLPVPNIQDRYKKKIKASGLWQVEGIQLDGNDKVYSESNIKRLEPNGKKLRLE